MAEEAEAQEGGLRSQMYKHEAMVEWVNEQYGVDLDTLSAAEVIAYAFASRVEWRKSDEYKGVVEAHAEEAAAAKEEKAKARAAKAAEAKAEKASAKKEAAPKKAAKATKAAKKTAKKATKASKAAATEDNPFD